jgi:type IV pilus assembly protein PilV
VRVNRARTRGFTLVEVLLSVAVLSLGLLGAAATLLGSVREYAEARRDITATSLLADMAQRIRANPAGRDAYGEAASGSSTACDDRACGAAERAMADLAWFAERARTLLTAESIVEFVPATGIAARDRYVMTLRFAADDALPGDISLALHVRAPVAG